MLNVLLSDFSIDSEEAYKNLKDIFKPMSKVLVLPYSNWEYLQDYNNFDDLYHPYYGEEMNHMARMLNIYGIQKEDINVISPKDTVEFIVERVRKADVILLSGGNPDQFVGYIPIEVWYELDYKDIIVGISAGSMVQCHLYYMFKDYEDDTVPFVKQNKYNLGMEYVWDIILVHYNGNPIQQQGIRNHNKTKHMPLMLIEDGGGLVYKDNELIKIW